MTPAPDVVPAATSAVVVMQMGHISRLHSGSYNEDGPGNPISTPAMMEWRQTLRLSSRKARTESSIWASRKNLSEEATHHTVELTRPLQRREMTHTG